MYVTDVLWWSYTLFMIVTAAFMIWFVMKVRAKGG